jgi:hypothetical protein
MGKYLLLMVKTHESSFQIFLWYNHVRAATGRTFEGSDFDRGAFMLRI